MVVKPTSSKSSVYHTIFDIWKHNKMAHIFRKKMFSFFFQPTILLFFIYQKSYDMRYGH